MLRRSGQGKKRLTNQLFYENYGQLGHFTVFFTIDPPLFEISGFSFEVMNLKTTKKDSR